jgi:hypothetical protein
MSNDVREIAADLFRKLEEEWLPEICRGDRVETFVQSSEADDVKGELRRGYRFFTADHSYHITATVREDGHTYFGCTASTRKPRAGEGHTRGNDLPDGKLTRETWDRIVRGILRYELVALYVASPYTADETKEDATGPSLGDEPPVEQGPPQENSLGHDFSHHVVDGYGACKCGAHENSEACLKPCPGGKDESTVLDDDFDIESAVIRGPDCPGCRGD